MRRGSWVRESDFLPRHQAPYRRDSDNATVRFQLHNQDPNHYNEHCYSQIVCHQSLIYSFQFKLTNPKSISTIAPVARQVLFVNSSGLMSVAITCSHNEAILTQIIQLATSSSEQIRYSNDIQFTFAETCTNFGVVATRIHEYSFHIPASTRIDSIILVLMLGKPFLVENGTLCTMIDFDLFPINTPVFVLVTVFTSIESTLAMQQDEKDPGTWTHEQVSPQDSCCVHRNSSRCFSTKVVI